MGDNGKYQADMTYNGAEFRRYLDEFKDWFDIQTDSEATNTIARIMRLVLPVHQMSEVDHESIAFRPPVARVVDDESDDSWGGDVVGL